MQGLEIEAVYEHGMLKLSRELPLQEGQTVTVTIHPVEGAAKRLSRLIQWKGSKEDLEYLTESDENGLLADNGTVQRFCGSLRWTRDSEELHTYLNEPFSS